MPVPLDQAIKFFVYIVESPSAVDLYHGRGEGGMVAQAVRLNQIQSVARTAVTREAFDAALKIGLPEEMQAHAGLLPVLHLSAHGNQDGIGLSNGVSVSWEDLRELLKPINKALEGKLIVCMSCCEGYAGIKMAMNEVDPDLPYLALIGSSASPTWGETAVAYATFYHLIARGEYLDDAIKAMKVASGHQNWVAERADESKKFYIDYLASLDAGKVQLQLEQGASVQETPRELAKLRSYEPGA